MLAAFAIALPAVLFIVDPIGVVPLFVALTGDETKERCADIARRACVVAAGMLTSFALFGTFIFTAFGVTLAAFRVAGGLLLMLTALDMLRAQHPGTKTSKRETEEAQDQTEIAIVPIAIPLLSGPGAIATVMVLMAQLGGGLNAAIPVISSIIITMLISYVLLRNAHAVKRVLRQSGIAILERVFGLILAAIAVQFVFDGGRELLKG